MDKSEGVILVASGWAIYLLVASKGLTVKRIVSALIRLTCPIAIVGSHYRVSLYSALFANVATYAMVGLVVETVRRHLNHSNYSRQLALSLASKTQVRRLCRDG